MKVRPIWSEILENDNFVCDSQTKQPNTAIADGLSGWGLCEAGNKPPENFGKGMVKIGVIAGISPTSDNLMKAANNL